MTPESRKFDRPGFLKKEVKTVPLARSIVLQVQELRNLPKNILDKVPKGYVIKEYDTSLQDMLVWYFREEFPDMPMVLSIKEILQEKNKKEPNLEELINYIENSGYEFRTRDGKSIRDHITYIEQESRPLAVAKRLKKRQEFQRDFFKDTLPNFVLESQFIIGSKDEKSPEHIYEIQPKIYASIDLGNIMKVFLHSIYSEEEEVRIIMAGDFLMDSLKKEFGKDNDKMKSLIDQLKAFALKLEQLLEGPGYTLDYSGNFNLIVTPEGILKLTDTNYLQTSKHGDSATPTYDTAGETTKRMVLVLNYVVKKLEEEIKNKK
ncbi:MAG: hypothetical protein KA515_00635 [Candidatus Pacebacteria bacterium]|nr:hypothetical protein [Candidatus Paceibacterota bacterium]